MDSVWQFAHCEWIARALRLIFIPFGLSGRGEAWVENASTINAINFAHSIQLMLLLLLLLMFPFLYLPAFVVVVDDDDAEKLKLNYHGR